MSDGATRRLEPAVRHLAQAPPCTLVIFGAAVLYSAAGGSLEPFALSHLVRFAVFLVMASIITLCNQELIRFAAYPVYGVVLLLLLAVVVGLVMVNLPTAGLDYHVPFGGTKASSYGPREQGRYAAEFYTTVKTAYTAA